VTLRLATHHIIVEHLPLQLLVQFLVMTLTNGP
jgi:hypothetical protein